MTDTETVAPDTTETPPGEAENAPPEEEPATGADEPEEEENTGESLTEDSEEEPEPEAQGMSEREMEKAIGKLEAEATRHANRISDIMGEDAQLLVKCELCSPNLPGFRWPAVPPEPVVQAVRAAIGLQDFTDFAKATHARECDDCRGRGNVLSGSKVAGMEAIQCPRCTGKGFIQVGTVPAAVVPNSGSNGDTTVPVLPDEGPSTKDPWGRDPTHPDFGVMPNLVAQRHAVQG